jgi:uroporphyrin-III C-methyltransferase
VSGAGARGAQPALGKVWIVGAGPGDPELLTVRAAKLIAQADDLVVDALVAPEIYRGARGRVIFVGKRAGRPRLSQRRIEEILVQLARERRRVVRLKGGDPSLFARLAEEVQALDAAGVPYEIVPGVSSLMAVPLAAGIPLTDRDAADRVVIMTGHRSAEGDAEPAVDLPRYDERTTYVLFMGLARLGELVREAIAKGFPADLPAVVVSKASLPD